MGGPNRETHRAESLELLIGDKASVQPKEEDGGVGQHAPQDDQVVHVRTGHLDEPGRGQKMIQNRCPHPAPPDPNPRFLPVLAHLWLRFLMLKKRKAPAMSMPRMVMVDRML